MQRTKKLSQIGVFGALAFIVMLFVIPFPLAPWLKFDISDVVVLFSGLVGGVGVACGVAIVKIMLHTMILSTQTAGIGEITNLVATVTYVLPIIWFYKKTDKMVVSLFLGLLTMTVIMVVGNYYYITPFYAKLFSMDFILEMMNNNKKEYLKYILVYYGGFNVFKGVVQSCIYYLIHKKMKNRYLTSIKKN